MVVQQQIDMTNLTSFKIWWINDEQIISMIIHSAPSFLGGLVIADKSKFIQVNIFIRNPNSSCQSVQEFLLS